MKLTILALIFLAEISVSGQVKKPEPTPVKVPFADSLQAIVVTTKDWTTTTGTARMFERTSRTAKWTQSGAEFPIVVGRSGLAPVSETLVNEEPAARLGTLGAQQLPSLDGAKLKPPYKKEGDGKSPAGMFPLTFAFAPAVKPEQLTFPYTQIEQFTECVDDTNSTHYNKVVGRMNVGNYDWKSSEKMFEIRPEYDLGVFVAYNSYPVVKGNGSCIFLHVWKLPTSTTSGCTAMERPSLERIVGWLDANKNPYLVQLTEDEYKSLQKKWNLPKIK